MESVRRASAFLFYLLGSAMIVLIVLAQRGMGSTRPLQILHILDLPILFLGAVLGGSSLYTGLTKGKSSIPLLIAIAFPLVVGFLFFLYCNFVLPFPEPDF
jgi:hypothetical protein